MKTLSTFQVKQFTKLFPELPTEVTDVVLKYSSGCTQLDIIGQDGYPSKRQVEWQLNKAAKLLGVTSIPSIRTVVQIRLYLAIIEKLTQ